MDAAAPVSRHERRMEIFTVVILSLAALATAWSGYQASLWDGIQSSNYTRASGARTEATQHRTAANEYRLADLSMFEGYIEAVIDGDEDVADFYLTRFRPEFLEGYEAWIALDPFDNPDAPASPLAMDEYRLAEDAAADDLEARADELLTEGEDANSFSDIYTLTTVLFAAALFFAAISERFLYVPAKMWLLGLAGLGLIVGIAIAFTQPITSG